MNPANASSGGRPVLLTRGTLSSKPMCHRFVILWLLLVAVVVAEDVRPDYIDLNFDGHPDKKILVSKGGGRNARNVTYEVWLFDPKTKDYVLSEQLSELSDPQPDAKSRTIRSFSRSFPIDTVEVFKWEGSRLILIEEITYEAKEGGIRETVKRLKDGKLQTISTSFHEAR